MKWLYHKMYFFPFPIFDTNWPSLMYMCPVTCEQLTNGSYVSVWPDLWPAERVPVTCRACTPDYRRGIPVEVKRRRTVGCRVRIHHEPASNFLIKQTKNKRKEEKEISNDFSSITAPEPVEPILLETWSRSRSRNYQSEDSWRKTNFYLHWYGTDWEQFNVAIHIWLELEPGPELKLWTKVQPEP